jgi:hypothetical protein
MNGFRFAMSRIDYEEKKNIKILLLVPLSIFIWLLFLAFVAYSGFFLNFNSLPPRILLAVIPPVIAILYLIYSGKLDKLLLKLRPWWLINLQVFRFAMEIILWMLFLEKIIPKQMTFEGYNFDVLVGVSAIPISYFCFKERKFSYKPVVVWNIFGLLLLLNIVVIAIISTPSPMRVFMNEPANTFIAFYPFIWLPGFVVPMALFLHLASLRQIKLKNGPVMDF